MKHFIYLFIFISFFSCVNQKQDSTSVQKLFLLIRRDSCSYHQYDYSRDTSTKGTIIFKYENEIRKRHLIFDTVRHLYKIAYRTDTVLLAFEEIKTIFINQKPFRVFVLSLDKYVDHWPYYFYLTARDGILLCQIPYEGLGCEILQTPNDQELSGLIYKLKPNALEPDPIIEQNRKFTPPKIIE